MKKDCTKLTFPDPVFSPKTLASMRQLTLPEAALNTRLALRDFVLAAGMEAFTKQLEDERTALCGPKGKFQVDRQAYRHGSDEGELVFGGRKVQLPKPRARTVDGRELELPTWREYSREDALNERVQEQILVGVSTRGYGRSLESLPEGLTEAGVSRSSVSRRFVARTAAQVNSFLHRPLEGIDLPVLQIDGVNLGEHLMLVALGIDADGRKQVLGVAEGSSESEAVGQSLFRNLIDRGLEVERARLFVIDGGKGVRKAIRAVFGEWALVQRCQIHKARNVLEHLPERQRAWVRAALRRAWSCNTVDRAREKLTSLADQLRAHHPGAAGSIEEGLEETLTLIALGVTGTLHQTLRSTNPIENLQGTIRRVTRNVKRWRGGFMALRWTTTALMEGEKKFRRVKGYRDLPRLTAALEACVAVPTVDRKERIA